MINYYKQKEIQLVPTKALCLWAFYLLWKIPTNHSVIRKQTSISYTPSQSLLGSVTIHPRKYQPQSEVAQHSTHWTILISFSPAQTLTPSCLVMHTNETPISWQVKFNTCSINILHMQHAILHCFSICLMFAKDTKTSTVYLALWKAIRIPWTSLSASLTIQSSNVNLRKPLQTQRVMMQKLSFVVFFHSFGHQDEILPSDQWKDKVESHTWLPWPENMAQHLPL